MLLMPLRLIGDRKDGVCLPLDGHKSAANTLPFLPCSTLRVDHLLWFRFFNSLPSPTISIHQNMEACLYENPARFFKVKVNSKISRVFMMKAKSLYPCWLLASSLMPANEWKTTCHNSRPRNYQLQQGEEKIQGYFILSIQTLETIKHSWFSKSLIKSAKLCWTFNIF